MEKSNPIQDPRKPRTILEFKNRQFQYMLSQTAIEVERMTITLENLSTGLRTVGQPVPPYPGRSAQSGAVGRCPCVRFTHGGRICRRTSSG